MERLMDVESIVDAAVFLMDIGDSVGWLEAIFVARYQAKFEGAWLLAFETVSRIELPKEQQEIVEKIREKAFNAAFQRLRNDEFAGLVCDDFEVIAKHAALGRSDCFVDFLVGAYVKGRFPVCD